MLEAGKIKVPQRVNDHFLAYINPQEAATLRAMGGGITAGGGQKMMNGIPSFSEAQMSDYGEENVGSTPTETSSASAGAGGEGGDPTMAELADHTTALGKSMATSITGPEGVVPDAVVSMAQGPASQSPQDVQSYLAEVVNTVGRRGVLGGIAELMGMPEQTALMAQGVNVALNAALAANPALAAIVGLPSLVSNIRDQYGKSAKNPDGLDFVDIFPGDEGYGSDIPD
jgi:hypothetical protein